MSTFAFLLMYYVSYVSSSGSRCRQLMDLANLEDGVFSQYSEDGVLIGLLDILGMNYDAPDSKSSKYYVEFGVENGVQCNTRILRERLGFSGLSMDGGNGNPSINLHEEFVTEWNILELLKKHKVPHDFDVLSVDVDMFDLWILAKILRDGTYRPRIIVVETNPTLCVNNYMQDYRKANSLPLAVTHPDLTKQTVWDSTRYSGANPKAFQMTAARFGYDMVHCERCGVNCFLVRRDSLPEQCRESFQDYMPMVPYPCFGTLTPEGAQMIGHPVDPEERPAVMLGHDLLDVMTRPRGDSEDLFVGAKHVDPLVMGHACGQGTASSPRGWMGDWCLKIYSLESTARREEDFEGFGRFNAAYMAFYRGEYGVAFSDFSMLLEGAKNQDSSNFGPCISSHASESGCTARAKCSFNAAVAALNVAAQASSVDNEAESRRQLGLAARYVELAVSFDQSDDHMRGLQQLVSFLQADIEDIASQFDTIVSVQMAITGIAEDGGDVTADVSLSSRDNVAATTIDLCERYNMTRANCASINTALGKELRNTLFPFSLVPFDFTGSGQLPGYGTIPKCLLHFPVVKLFATI